MEVEAAGAQVGAGQTLPAQGGTIGAAAHRHFLGGQTGLFDGFAGVLHQMEVGLDLFQHVAVAVLDLHLHGAGAVLAVEVIGNVEEVILLVLQLIGIVVAQDVAQLGVGHVAVHLAEVVEALTALGGLGTGHDGQGSVELHGHIGGVDHGILGGAGMHREAVDGHGGGSCVEVLILDAAHVTAINGVGEIRAKARDIEEGSALADLLVGGEGDAELAVGTALGKEDLGGGQDLCHTGLVVCAQQGGAVGGDQGLTLEVGQEGEGGDLHHHAGGGQGDIAAVIILVQDGGNTLAGSIGGGVHVGNQAQGRLVLTAGGGGDAAVDIAVLVYPGIFDAQSLHLFHQLAGQVKLPLCRGVSAALGVGGSVNADIIQQSLVCTHKNAPLLVFDSMIRFSAAIYKRVQQGSADRSAVKQQKHRQPVVSG